MIKLINVHAAETKNNKAPMIAALRAKQKYL